tara:strand:- start:858 stop:1259 length:402 start_codon:yes stop_codon:yes gene_type:complete
MPTGPVVTRLLLGLIFLVFGLNGFLLFITPPPLPEAAGALLGALDASMYFLPVLNMTEIVCGIALLTGVCVPLALIVLAPIVTQIFLFHLVLAPSGLVLAILMVILQTYLGFVAYRGNFDELLILWARPDTEA